MFECIAPRFYGVSAQQSVPFQLIYRKSWMLNGGKYPRKSYILNMSLCPELNSRETQRDFPFDRSAKNLRQKIRHHKPIVVDAVTPSAGEPRGVENVVSQMDVPPCIAASPLVLAIRKSPLAPHIHMSCGGQRRTKRLAEIQQLHPSPVAKTPFRF